MPVTLVPEEIEAYAAAHTTPLPPLLDELAAATQERFGGLSTMLSGQTVGTLLQMLLFASNAKRVLEIGMFTGLSAQMMAAALPDDGRVITCDVYPKAIETGEGVLRPRPARAQDRGARRAGAGDDEDARAGLRARIHRCRQGQLPQLLRGRAALLAPRGIIAVDNVLWSGRVLDPQSDDDRRDRRVQRPRRRRPARDAGDADRARRRHAHPAGVALERALLASAELCWTGHAHAVIRSSKKPSSPASRWR